jgi:hypothetical protein
MISVMTGVTVVTVPNIMGGGGRGESTGHRTLKGRKLPRTIAPKKLTPGRKVLHRKPKRVIDRTIIIRSKLTDKYKILNYARCNKDITEMKLTIRGKKREESMPKRGNGNRRAVSNSNMAINRVWKDREQRIPASCW